MTGSGAVVALAMNMNLATKERFEEMIRLGFPAATLESEPAGKAGFWIDVRLGDVHACVEYHPEKGFGVSSITDSVGYGEGHDAIADSAEDAFRLVRDIIMKAKPA